jgi:hypothetical protein
MTLQGNKDPAVITIYQLRRLGKSNPMFPEDYRKVFHVNTHSPRIAWEATQPELDAHTVSIIDWDHARSTGVGDIMVLDRCVVLLVEKAGFSYQFDLRDKDMASNSKEIQFLKG